MVYKNGFCNIAKQMSKPKETILPYIPKKFLFLKIRSRDEINKVFPIPYLFSLDLVKIKNILL